MHPQTPQQTIGPYFSIGTDALNTNRLAGPGIAGEPLVIRGRILDGDRNPVPDALIETWQANAQGKYPHPEDARPLPVETTFRGWARVPTDDEGRFHVTTVKPGRVPGCGGGLQAPHIAVFLHVRGLLYPLLTRIYFPDEPANETDPVLQSVPANRRSTLILKETAGAENTLEWQVVLQGEGETVFFDW
jgi:protocatechuate 3,4-dioxygenase alpha subunit